MVKKVIRKWMPNPNQIKEHKHLKIFGKLILSPNLWHLNRHSVSRAFAVGLFAAWVPVPFQMVLAAAGAILFNSNLPLSVALVWITNPVTMPVLYYFSYRVGLLVLNMPPSDFAFELSYEWLSNGLMYIWQPFLLGCFICGVVSAVVSYFTIQYAWRYSIVKQRERKKKQRTPKLNEI